MRNSGLSGLQHGQLIPPPTPAWRRMVFASSPSCCRNALGLLSVMKSMDVDCMDALVAAGAEAGTGAGAAVGVAFVGDVCSVGGVLARCEVALVLGAAFVLDEP